MTSKRLATAKRFLDHFTSLDPNILEDILADNYIHDFAPGSITHPGPFGKKGLVDFVTNVRHTMKAYPMTIKEALESESSNAVTLWVTGQVFFHDEVMDDGISKEDWEYKGEYIFLLYLDEAGEKLTKTIEFIDSKATDKLVGLATRAEANLARKQGQ